MLGAELLLTGTLANAVGVSNLGIQTDKHRVPRESALLAAFKSLISREILRHKEASE